MAGAWPREKERAMRLPLPRWAALCPPRSPALLVRGRGGSRTAGTSALLSQCVVCHVCVQVAGRPPSQPPRSSARQALLPSFSIVSDLTQALSN